MANLTAILQHLEPVHLAEVVDLPQDAAREHYPLNKLRVQSYPEFRSEVGRFFIYQYQAVMASGVAMPGYMAEGFAFEILESAFGSVGGLPGAYHIASTGAAFRDGRGGLAAICDVIYLALKKETRERYIDYVLRTFVNPLDWNDRVALMRAYLKRYGRYATSGSAKSAEELATRHEDIIRMHVEVLNAISPHVRR